MSAVGEVSVVFSTGTFNRILTSERIRSVLVLIYFILIFFKENEIRAELCQLQINKVDEPYSELM